MKVPKNELSVVVEFVLDCLSAAAGGRGGWRVGALGRRSGRAQRVLCWGVSGVGARVVVVRGLAVVRSVVCIFD